MTEVPFQGIHVLAGPNGGGKSSVAGSWLEAAGGEYFNPDVVTKRILEANPALLPDEANSRAWHGMVRLLRRAIDRRATFAFETTLGGRTITRELERAARAGLDVRVWYVALSSADQHVDRVRRRVAQGAIPFPKRRFESGTTAAA